MEKNKKYLIGLFISLLFLILSAILLGVWSFNGLSVFLFVIFLILTIVFLILLTYDRYENFVLTGQWNFFN